MTIPAREEIARAIDPHAWLFKDDYTSEHHAKRRDVSLNQADNVIKLLERKQRRARTEQME